MTAGEESGREREREGGDRIWENLHNRTKWTLAQSPLMCLVTNKRRRTNLISLHADRGVAENVYKKRLTLAFYYIIFLSLYVYMPFIKCIKYVLNKPRILNLINNNIIYCLY
jgi:hypothetical protein